MLIYSGSEEGVAYLVQILRMDFLLPTSIEDDRSRRIEKETWPY